MAKFNMVIFILINSLALMATNVESTLINNKVVKFRVYTHAVRSGPDANSYEVARANITANSPTSFGLVTVGDSLITSGPDMNTGALGRAQGITVYSGIRELVQLLTVDFMFTEGKYRGSTLTAVGRLNQDISIVGGTGFFRLARGYISTSVYSNDPTTGRLVIEYLFYVYLN